MLDDLAPFRARLNPDREEMRERLSPSLRDAVDLEPHLFARRHGQAVRILAEAEMYQCRARVGALIEVAPKLVVDALPADFFHRLVCLEGALRSKGNRGPRYPERDDRIRDAFERLRVEQYSGPEGVLSYKDALDAIAKRILRTPDAVEKIIQGKFTTSAAMRDYNSAESLERLNKYISDNFRKKPG